MKKKKNPVIIAIFVLLIVLAVIIYFYISPSESEISGSKENVNNGEDITEIRVSLQTIENTLSSSGQVSSALDEKLYLHSSYYFSELLVEENIFIEEGTNILKYTNGTYLTAPYDCVVISSSLPEESEVCTSSHYIEINSIDTLAMSLNVSETEISKVSIGDEVNITITATSEKLTGHITSISEVGTYSSSGSYFTASVQFENNGNVKVGMSATCEIIVERVEDAIAVPIEAVQESDNGKYVIVVDSLGNASNVGVETGISNDAYIEIKSGLTGNETVQMKKTSSSSSKFSGGGNFERGGNSKEGMPDFPSGGNMPQMPSGGGMQKN